MEAVAARRPSLLQRARWRLQDLRRAIRDRVRALLVRALIRASRDSNLVAHGRRELASSLAGPDGPNRWMAENLLELLAVFSAQGHSGFSAGWCISSFEQLARFKPLGPLTGEPAEWMEIGTGVFQNVRCGRVFRSADRFGGQAYDIEGRVFRDPDGSCCTNSDSHVPITFPYTPTTVIVDRPA